MPRTEGSGQEGTKELLSVASPLVAALMMSPAGRGLGGIAASMGLNTLDSEAGVFSPLGRLMKGGAKLVDEGVAVFPDMTRNAELPTTGFASRIAMNRDDIRTLSAYISQPDNMRHLSNEDRNKIGEAIMRMQKTPIKTDTQERMIKFGGADERTNAFYRFPTINEPQGSIVVKEKGFPKDMAASATHEFTHDLDYVDDVFKSIMGADPTTLDYMVDVTETRAFLAGSRAHFDETLTNPHSEDFVHPMISYAGGEVSAAPFYAYKNALEASYRVVGRKVDKTHMSEYRKAIEDEANFIRFKVETNPKFKAKLEAATIDTSQSNSDWVHNFKQQQALQAQREINFNQGN